MAEALTPVAPQSWLITNHPLTHLALGLPLVTDLCPFQGPAGGLLTALFYRDDSWVLAAVDNPFLAPALITTMAARVRATSRPAVVCQSPWGLEPFPGLYHVRLLPKLAAFLQSERRATRFLSVCRPEIVPPEEVKGLDPDGPQLFQPQYPRGFGPGHCLAGPGGPRRPLKVAAAAGRWP